MHDSLPLIFSRLLIPGCHHWPEVSLPSFIQSGIIPSSDGGSHQHLHANNNEQCLATTGVLRDHNNSKDSSTRRNSNNEKCITIDLYNNAEFVLFISVAESFLPLICSSHLERWASRGHFLLSSTSMELLLWAS